MSKKDKEQSTNEQANELFKDVGTSKVGKEQTWIAKQKFRCIKNFNVLYNVGDLVPYTEDREAKGLIELKK